MMIFDSETELLAVIEIKIHGYPHTFRNVVTPNAFSRRLKMTDESPEIAPALRK